MRYDYTDIIKALTRLPDALKTDRCLPDVNKPAWESVDSKLREIATRLRKGDDRAMWESLNMIHNMQTIHARFFLSPAKKLLKEMERWMKFTYKSNKAEQQLKTLQYQISHPGDHDEKA